MGGGGGGGCVYVGGCMIRAMFVSQCYCDGCVSFAVNISVSKTRILNTCSCDSLHG